MGPEMPYRPAHSPGTLRGGRRGRGLAPSLEPSVAAPPIGPSRRAGRCVGPSESMFCASTRRSSGKSRCRARPHREAAQPLLRRHLRGDRPRHRQGSPSLVPRWRNTHGSREGPRRSGEAPTRRQLPGTRSDQPRRLPRGALAADQAGPAPQVDLQLLQEQHRQPRGAEDWGDPAPEAHRRGPRHVLRRPAR